MPSVFTFSRSRSTFTWGTVVRKAVKSPLSSGRCARGGEELAGGVVELARASARPVLHLELQPPGVSQAGDGRGREDERHRIGVRTELAAGAIENRRKLRVRGPALLPGFQVHDEAGIVGAVHVCEDVPSGLRHDTLHALHFAQETLGPSRHRIGTLH